MTNKWRINGTDIYSTYGVAIKRGSYLELMTPPTPRKRLEHEYSDANGAQVDTQSALTYEPRRFTVKVVIIADNYAQFWARYNAFIASIATPASFALWVKDIGITANLIYEGMKCTDKPSSLRSGKIAVSYDLSVFEPNPVNRTYEST